MLSVNKKYKNINFDIMMYHIIWKNVGPITKCDLNGLNIIEIYRMKNPCNNQTVSTGTSEISLFFFKY